VAFEVLRFISEVQIILGGREGGIRTISPRDWPLLRDASSSHSGVLCSLLDMPIQITPVFFMPARPCYAAPASISGCRTAMRAN
jgi:hypothetical protein